MSSVVVFSLPVCVQCKATKRAFDKAGVAYREVDLSVDTGALSKVKALGYQSAPVVVAGQEHWSGYRPDKIKDLAEKLNTRKR